MIIPTMATTTITTTAITNIRIFGKPPLFATSGAGDCTGRGGISADAVTDPGDITGSTGAAAWGTRAGAGSKDAEGSAGTCTGGGAMVSPGVVV